jgi:hypothetical protein
LPQRLSGDCCSFIKWTRRLSIRPRCFLKMCASSIMHCETGLYNLYSMSCTATQRLHRTYPDLDIVFPKVPPLPVLPLDDWWQINSESTLEDRIREQAFLICHRIDCQGVMCPGHCEYLGTLTRQKKDLLSVAHASRPGSSTCATGRPSTRTWPTNTEVVRTQTDGLPVACQV